MNKRFTALMTTLIISVFFSISASAYDIEVDGIYYNIIEENKVEVTFGNSKYVGDIVIPEKIKSSGVEYDVTQIGENAFVDCKDVLSIKIAKSIMTIGKCAFMDSNLNSITLPNKITHIGKYAFTRCYKLSSIYISDICSWCNINFENADSNPLSYGSNFYINGIKITELNIPNSVTKINNFAFYHFLSLESISISNSVTEIGNEAFYYTSLKSLVIPNSVKKIGKKAFCSCRQLSSVTISPSVESIGESAFEDCGPCSTYISNLASWCKIKFTNQNSNPLCNGGGGLYLNNSLIKELTIPDDVSNVGDCAFYNNSSIVSVNIPNTVSSIGDYCFCRCYNLKEVSLPNTLKSIGNGAFRGCYKLSSINIPSSISIIEGLVFEGCENITSILLPNAIHTIESSAFQNCKRLSSIRIPNSVKNINSSVFAGCEKLHSIRIPNKVKSLGEQVFAGCHELSNVIIGPSVNKIDYEAFIDCYILKDVYCYSNWVPMLQNNSFQKKSIDNITLHIPMSLLADYKYSDVWKDFGDIVGFKDSPSQIITYANAGSHTRYATYSNNLFDTELHVDEDKYLKLYNVSIDQGKMILKERLNNKVACGEGVLICTNSEYVNIKKLSEYNLSENYNMKTMLNASFVEDKIVDAPKEHKLYSLTFNDLSNKSGLGFYLGVTKNENGIIISNDGSQIVTKPYEAYLEVPVSELDSNMSYPKVFVLEDNESTDINILNNNNANNINIQYDINGHKVHESYKGLKIIKNRKYINN